MRIKKTVAFVGGFSKADGVVGGGVYTDSRLLVESPLAQVVNWRLIDSSQRSLPLPNMGIRAWDAGRRVWQLRRLLRAGGIDAVLIYSPFVGAGFLEKGVMCWVARRHRARVVLRFQSEIRAFGRFRRLAAAFVRWVLGQCDVLMCQTALAAENLLAIYRCDASKVAVVPNWIDLKPYASFIASRETPRPPDRVPNVVFLGRLEVSKGIIDLIEAVRRLVAEGLVFEVNLCGSGDQQEALQRLCQSRGLERIVKFSGWVDDKQKYAALAAADLLVLPSHSEGLPNVLIEAMAAGLAVVTTPVGGIPSVVQTGRNGILVPPRDAAKLAEAIELLLRDDPLRRKMGAANRRQIEQEHDLAAIWPRVAAMLTGDAEWNDVVVAQGEAVSAVGGSLANEAQVG